MKTTLQFSKENRTVLEKDFGQNGKQGGAALEKDFGQSGKQRGAAWVKDFGQNERKIKNTLVFDGKISNLTDSELYKKCQEYGLNARVWMRRFAGLLPEVYRRKLYKRRGYISIHEFAAKLAGMNQTTVDKILNLAKRLSDKPKLSHLLETGKCGWSKLEKVSFRATPETDKFWTEKVKTLNTRTLEQYIRGSKKTYGQENRLEFAHVSDGENNSQISEDSLNKSKKIIVPMPLDQEIHGELLQLKQKFEKEKGEKSDWNMVMKMMLEGYKKSAKQSEPKTEIITTNICPKCIQEKENEREQKREVTRYIPSESRKIIQTRSEGKCEFKNCNRPGEIYHHTRRFALKKNHDPTYIRFLCKAHEGMLQAGLIENEEQDPTFWNIKKKSDWWDLKNIIDGRVAEFRREPAFLE